MRSWAYFTQRSIGINVCVCVQRCGYVYYWKRDSTSQSHQRIHLTISPRIYIVHICIYGSLCVQPTSYKWHCKQFLLSFFFLFHFSHWFHFSFTLRRLSVPFRSPFSLHVSIMILKYAHATTWMLMIAATQSLLSSLNAFQNYYSTTAWKWTKKIKRKDKTWKKKNTAWMNRLNRLAGAILTVTCNFCYSQPVCHCVPCFDIVVSLTVKTIAMTIK